MSNFLKILIILLVTACASPQKINVQKLKPEDRVYAGKVEIQLNDLKNKDVSCDIFLNIDLNPVIRISPDGFYSFKTNRKHLAFGKIACLQRVNGESKWIYHSIDFKKIKKAEDENTITSLGIMNITWKFDKSVFDKPATRFGNDASNSIIEDIGKFNVEIKPDIEEVSNYMRNQFSEFKDTKYKFVEKIFQKNEDD